MRKVFICSPLRAGNGRTEGENEEAAERFCRFACEAGQAPFAPHLFYTRFLDDHNKAEREAGIASGIEFLRVCDEFWVGVWPGEDLSEGMKQEFDRAVSFGIPIKWFVLSERGKPPALYDSNSMVRRLLTAQVHDRCIKTEAPA